MAAPSDEGPVRTRNAVTPSLVDSRVVHLRLLARVVADDLRVRLVGGGPMVEITPQGARRARAHNELVTLPLSDVLGVEVEQAERLLRRWQALDHRVHVEVVTLRGGDGTSRPGRRVEITGHDGAVLRWHEPGLVECERAGGNRFDSGIG